MFIPGVGAVVRLKQYPADRREDARVGLAGPIWGLGAAVVVGAMWLGTGEGLLVLLGLAAAASAGFTEGADQPYPTILVQYGLLVVLLSLVSWSAVVAA